MTAQLAGSTKAEKLADAIQLFHYKETTQAAAELLRLSPIELRAEALEQGNVSFRNTLERLRAECEVLRKEVIGCFDAAEAEGLSQALSETPDAHLKDLVERRLMYALYAAKGEKHD